MPDAIKSILAEFSALLRYIAPGFVALFIWVGVNKDSPLLNNNYPVWAVVAAGALLGIAIYTVHSSVIAQVFSWRLIVCIHLESPKCNCVLVCLYARYKKAGEEMFKLDIARWERRASIDPVVKTIQAEIDKWSALQNFLSCSSYSLIVIPIYTKCRRSGHVQDWWYWVLILGIIMICCALYSEYRKTKHEFWAKQHYPGGSKSDEQSKA